MVSREQVADTGDPAPGTLFTLLACLRPRFSADDTSRLRCVLAEFCDWRTLVSEAERHGVAALLHQHLRALEQASDFVFPAPASEQLLIEHRRLAFRNLHLTGELAELLVALRNRGVNAMPVKGPLLATELYGDVSLRQFADLDVLVASTDFPIARQAVVDLGYVRQDLRTPAQQRSLSRTSHEESFVRGDVIVELQWRIADAFYGVELRIEELWSHRRAARLVDDSFPTPGPEDLLLVLCVHASTHAWDRLIWIVDVAEVVRRASQDTDRQFDWNQAIRIAHRHNSSRRLRLGLALASALLGATAPADVMHWIDRDARIPYLVEYVRRELAGRAPRDLKA